MSREMRPQRGEIWLIDFEPTIGSEIKKIRPALVISSDAINKLPIKVEVFARPLLDVGSILMCQKFAAK